MSSQEMVEDSSEICGIQPLDPLKIRPLDLLNPEKVFRLKVSSDLAGGDYHTKQYLASERGHKFVKQLNPSLISVKPLLDKMKEPSVLLLRGCELLLQSPGFPFDKFNSITTLEISGNRHLTSLPENTISQMTRLQSLNLSYLQINRLPADLFINAADHLRSLIIRGCPNLHVLSELPETLRVLEYIDFSHLPIDMVSVQFFSSNLHTVILKGCFNIVYVPLHVLVKRLDFIDVSHCTSLKLIKLRPVNSDSGMVLDLSNTEVKSKDVPHYVSHLYFRNAKLGMSLNSSFHLMINLKVCDLSGCTCLQDADILDHFPNLEALDLSRTEIRSISGLSKLTSLRTLVLRDCRYLEHLPSIEHLENLEVLDLSGCEILGDLPQGLSQQRLMTELNLYGCKGLTELMEGIFDDMPCLEKLDLSNTGIKNMPSFVSLLNIGTVINHSPKSVPESSNSGIIEMSGLDPIGSISELHLVSTFISNSAFDKFRYECGDLHIYVSDLENKIISSVADTKVAGVKRQFGSMRDDLDYILGKMDLMESSQNSMSCEDLLHEIMSYDYNSLEAHSSILKKLIRTVVKLKNLVPPPSKTRQVKECVKKLEMPSPSYTSDYEMENRKLIEYESLTTIQRNCLLYFACLCSPTSLISCFKERVLFHLWYGEGFFDTLLYADFTSNPLHVSRMPSGVQQVTTSNRIDEIGHEVLQVLKGKYFVCPTGCNFWSMHQFVYKFLIIKAREENSFDFNNRGNLTPKIGASTRTCLLKPDIDHPPSSQVWLNYTNSSELLETFKTVRTLLYINEPVVDINTKWFSHMTNLCVLHLANLYSEQQINIVDLKFLEELKSMKQLRLLNLQSFAAIKKLPDSICQLTKLEILNLGYCTNLIELPPGIASLTNLIVLDLTQCHLLPQLPKGLASLSKLEVLKGFPITYEANGRQSKKACTLRGLLKLQSLRKLNIVVNKDSFPDTMDLQVLRNMEELRILKITWYQAIYKEEYLGNEVEKVAVRHSRWKQFRCWVPRNEKEEEELLLPNCSLRNLNKLVLSCFPCETAPNWLNPNELQNLERLYIVGGSLKTLFEDQTAATWKIKSLKLRYLSDLQMDWKLIEGSFPCTGRYGAKVQCCPHTKNFR